ncbi:MAG: hypothetical protein GY906_19110 [bacterium]|nr:hypothetical protein [bacterium]
MAIGSLTLSHALGFEGARSIRHSQPPSSSSSSSSSCGEVREEYDDDDDNDDDEDRFHTIRWRWEAGRQYGANGTNGYTGLRGGRQDGTTGRK